MVKFKEVNFETETHKGFSSKNKQKDGKINFNVDLNEESSIGEKSNNSTTHQVQVHPLCVCVCVCLKFKGRM